jgi:hypothetical protein
MRAAKAALPVPLVLTVQISQSALGRQRCPHRALRIIFLSQGVAEQGHQPVADFLCDMAAHFRDSCGSNIEIGTDEIAPFFSVELCGNTGRIHQIAEHHRDMPALAHGLGRWCRSRCYRGSRRYCFRAGVSAQRCNGVKQLQPMPDCRDAKLLQGLVRQTRKDRLVYLILAERRLILSEAQAPQPDHDVHD